MTAKYKYIKVLQWKGDYEGDTWEDQEECNANNVADVKEIRRLRTEYRIAFGTGVFRIIERRELSKVQSIVTAKEITAECKKYGQYTKSGNDLYTGWRVNDEGYVYHNDYEVYCDESSSIGTWQAFVRNITRQ
jgi:hypothetical protein